jgi:hypothetical protein
MRKNMGSVIAWAIKVPCFEKLKDHEEMMVMDGKQPSEQSRVGLPENRSLIQEQKESSHGVRGGHGRCPALHYLSRKLRE